MDLFVRRFDDPAKPVLVVVHGGPVLIVHGSREMGFPIGVARRLHAELSASTLAGIPDAAHMAHFDNPAAWTAAIRAFLAPNLLAQLHAG